MCFVHSCISRWNKSNHLTTVFCTGLARKRHYAYKLRFDDGSAVPLIDNEFAVEKLAWKSSAIAIWNVNCGRDRSVTMIAGRRAGVSLWSWWKPTVWKYRRTGRNVLLREIVRKCNVSRIVTGEMVHLIVYSSKIRSMWEERKEGKLKAFLDMISFRL